jgi:tetratricopeptide (TPR) repeat protein
LKFWPKGETAGEAQWELGRLHEAAEQWRAAREVYQQIDARHPRFTTALDAIARVWPREMKSHPARTDDIAAFYRGKIAPAESALPEVFNDAQRAAALGGARLLLQHARDGHAAAEELLVAALAGSPDAPAEWRSAAQALSVVALAGQPKKRAEAEAQLQKFAGDDPRQLLEMLQGLTELAAGSDAAVRRELAALQLGAIDRLRPQASKLDAGQRLALEKVAADALASAGQREQALAAYEALATAQPDRGDIQEGYAALLADALDTDKAALEKALGRWRIIAQASRPRTDRWWRAKYQVALLCQRLGDKEQAAKLVRYLEATPPGLDGSPLEREFRELLK